MIDTHYKFSREEELNILIDGWFRRHSIDYLIEARWLYTREELKESHFVEYKGMDEATGMALGGFTDEAIELAKFYIL
jgi:hypothetical protein